MEHCRDGYRFAVAFAVALSLPGLSACGAENGARESGDDEPLARAEERVIPDATVTQVTQSLYLAPGQTATDAFARCPSNSELVGGGHFLTASGAAVLDVRVYASYGFKNDWRISVANLS